MNPNAETKYCIACRIEHPIEDFGARNSVPHASKLCKAAQRFRSKMSYRRRKIRNQKEDQGPIPLDWENRLKLRSLVIQYLESSSEKISAKLSRVDGAKTEACLGSPRVEIERPFGKTAISLIRAFLPKEIAESTLDSDAIAYRLTELGYRINGEPQEMESSIGRDERMQYGAL